MKFNIIIPYFNESLNIQRTIDSIFFQSNFSSLVSKIVFFNDCSTDNSEELVFESCNKRKDAVNIVHLKSEKNLNNAEIFVRMLKECDDDSIVVWLDGGDWLCDTDALRMIHDAYVKTGCDILWTNHRFDYSGMNISKALSAWANVYEHPWVTSALRTFKKSLYNQISVQNLKDRDGNFIRWARDQALYLPMLHIAKKRMYLPIVAYHYAWYDDGRIDRTSDSYKSKKETEQKASELFIRNRGFVTKE